MIAANTPSPEIATNICVCVRPIGTSVVVGQASSSRSALASSLGIIIFVVGFSCVVGHDENIITNKQDRCMSTVYLSTAKKISRECAKEERSVRAGPTWYLGLN